MRVFGPSLAKLRQKAGFKSAYQFYHQNGGRRHFPFTYVHYLRIEQGKRLPKPVCLKPIVTALRMAPATAESLSLFRAYLRDFLGSDEACELILEPLLAGGAATAEGRPAGLGLLRSEHSIHLTPEQFKLLAQDETAYWCSEVLLNDQGKWTAEDVGRVIGRGASEAARALRSLKTAGLVVERPRGRFAGRWPGKLYTFPGRLTGMWGLMDSIYQHWERMHQRTKGPTLGARVELVRAEEDSLRRYIGSLGEAVDSVNAYATRSKGDKTGLFLVEARVRKLLPF